MTYFVVLALVFVLSGVLVFGVPLLVVLLLAWLLLDCTLVFYFLFRLISVYILR